MMSSRSSLAGVSDPVKHLLISQLSGFVRYLHGTGGRNVDETAEMTPSGGNGGKRPSKKKTKARRKQAAGKRSVSNKSRKRGATKKAAGKKGKKEAAADPPAAEPPPIEHHLTPQGRGRRGEHRSEERHDIPGLIEVEIELFGYQRDAREFGIGPTPDVNKKIHSNGTTMNLSLGGMLARIADPITEGSYCLVHFVNAGGNVRPELRWGVALRCEEVAPGIFEIAVQFSSPLEHLDADAIAAA
jgi:hypothetical protein